MKTTRLPVTALAVLLAGCATSSRVSTAEERASAEALVMDAETLLIAAHAKRYVSEEDFTNGKTAIASLRAEIARSETVPVAWDALARRALVLSLTWVPEKK